MKRKRYRFIPPDKARAAVLGFYQAIPSPMRFTCPVCGEDHNSIGQEAGVCLSCRWAKRAEERQDGSAN